MSGSNRLFKFSVVIVAIFTSHYSLFTPLSAQVAGTSIVALLNSPSSARTAALGVSYLSIYSPFDLNVGLDNPSLISSEYNNRLAVNYVSLFARSNNASVAYGRDFHRFGTFLFSLHYNGYGRFESYDEMETSRSNFTASDVALSLAWGLNIDSSFSIGASFKPILSQYESYTAFAFALNVAGSYISSDKRFAATLQARNAGAQIATFDGTNERLPFDLSVSLSYKVKNAPFRFFFMADQLTHWNLSYDDPLNSENEIDPYTGQPVEKAWYEGISNALDLAARHASLGIEIDLRSHLFVRLGYRYRQTAEMAANDRTNINLSGFSYGFGWKAKRFEFSFARRNYHLGQAPNYLSLLLKL